MTGAALNWMRVKEEPASVACRQEHVTDMRADGSIAKARQTQARRKRKNKPDMTDGFHGNLPNNQWLNGRRLLYLNVPFAEKDIAKSLGACWNPQKRKWWIFADVERLPFRRWLTDEAAAKAARQCAEQQRHEQCQAERRLRWHAIHPDKPWPGDCA